METLELPLPVPAPPAPAPTRHGFRLHPALDASKYEMPGSLASVRRWKAFCYVGNDCEEKDAQQMQDVGYVMVSLVDDTVIPIARGDEHHRGYDLLHDFASGEYATYQMPSSRRGRKPKPGPGLDIRARDYVPVWSHGTNYVYGPKDVADMTEALRRWLSYGGRDGIVIGANDLRGRALSSSGMVASGGDFTFAPGTLAPLGAEIYARLEKLSATLVTLGREPTRPAMSDAFRQTADLMTMIEPFGYQIGVSQEFRREALVRLKEARRSGDSQKLWELVFGFSGIKNVMHVYLREETAKDWAWSRDHLSSIWGDPGLAIDMLGRL
jgi:hypothetical protein